MNRQILCNWLGIKDQSWPPDHRVLLGLKPEENDPAHIEKQVHDRLAMLRCYQLAHPEEATEGMNRLAQAYICLTEHLVSKSSPPLQTQQTAPAPSPAQPQALPSEEKRKEAPADETEINQGTELDWKVAPPPLRIDHPASGVVQEIKAETVPQPVAAIPSQTVPVTIPVSPPRPEPVDPIIELAYHSLEARRGLGTLAQLVERIDHTRKLLVAWQKAGKYLGQPQRKFCRAAEEKDLERKLNAIFDLLGTYPHFIGQPGCPGYRVVAMARLEMTALMFKNMDGEQRLHLARDWQAGQAVLLAHRRFLHGRFKTMRHEGLPKQVLRAIRGIISDHPLIMGFLAITFTIASFLGYRYFFKG